MPLTFSIVTFNEREAAAIQALFLALLNSLGGWRASGSDKVSVGSGRFTLTLRHVPLNSQGNVVAATSLAQLFNESNLNGDFTLFYGCAGVVDPKWLKQVFLVGEVTYASLGTVAAGRPEHVTLKNKWICHTDPNEVQPLDSVSFPNVLGLGALDLEQITGFEIAHVLATDKVIKVGPAPSAPPAKRTGPPHKVYTKAEWSYGDALALVQSECGGKPLLVEMESFGIGMLAKALKIEDRTIVIRVTTDALTDHTGSDQQQADLLVQFNRSVLAIVVPVTLHAWGQWP
jgi:hypothetical protein